ncbi:carboxylesterase 1D-like [Branchiostoma lanceolatum]|uniref:carboxylesterase 1D-like n=1 Tax=Branchiostoma lanceolatum TaxID=7740 RepID=UPI003452CF37
MPLFIANILSTTADASVKSFANMFVAHEFSNQIRHTRGVVPWEHLVTLHTLNCPLTSDPNPSNGVAEVSLVTRLETPAVSRPPSEEGRTLQILTRHMIEDSLCYIMGMLLCTALLLSGAIIPVLADDVSPVVTTASGKVRGTVQYTNDLPDKPVYTFKGIPYAAPPVGDLRFRAPQPAAPWEGVRDASQLGPFCPQDNLIFSIFPVQMEQISFSEDCLTLNVETPTLERDAGLPVLVWLHGGALILGAGWVMPHASLSAHQDAVVVSINYRVGVHGFLSTGDANAPGNFGLLDQVQAMVWVQENIRNFGGDPDRVTIFGQSAGGASVCYHVVSPLSKGLFQRAISQSGVCQAVEVNPKPLPRAVMLAEVLNCDTKDTASMVACLRHKSSDELITGHQGVMKKLNFEEVPFPPVVDTAYLPSHPNDLFDQGRTNPVDYLLGVNNHEYGYVVPLGVVPNYGQGMTKDTSLLTLKRTLSRAYPSSNDDDMITAVSKVYFDHDNPDDPMAIQHQFSLAAGDELFVAPTLLIADKYAASGRNVYLYENQYVPSWLTAARPDWVGCDHMDDLYIMSGVAFLDVRKSDGEFMVFNSEDKRTSMDMMAYWANFARTGNPSDRTGGPADSPTVPEWPQYTPDNPAHMKLDLTSSADVGFHPDRMALRNDVIPKFATASDRDEL